jgi:hypothetical protein
MHSMYVLFMIAREAGAGGDGSESEPAPVDVAVTMLSCPHLL